MSDHPEPEEAFVEEIVDDAPSTKRAPLVVERKETTIREGEVIAGKYRVDRVIGRGGMGCVLAARHLGLDEPVAIKVLRPAMLEVPGMVTRFLREARAASKIKSQHVVRVTDVDTLVSGLPYMVMEYLDGTDLSAYRKQRGPLPIEEAVGYVIEACEALAEAHELGIVHRDLKPANLFLARLRDNKTIVKVLDFGISKLESPGDQDTTRTGTMMGSPKYMSPEQMMSMHNVDGRADIWALGAILYELFTGRPPFVAETTPKICALVLNAEPAPPRELRPDLPEGLEAIVLRCLQKSPDPRFASVRDLVAALAPYAPAGAAASASAGAATGPLPALDSAASQGQTGSVSVWNATSSSPAVKRPSGAAIAAVLGIAVVIVGVIIGLARGGASASASAPVSAPVPASVSASGSASGSASASASAPALTAKPLGKPVAPAAHTTKPAPTTKKPPIESDPFGGQRN